MDASEKTNSSLCRVVSKETGRYGLGMWSCSSALSESFQDFHFVSFSAGIGTSHSQCSIHSSLTIALHCTCTVIGATNPSGSNMLLTVERIPLRVNGFSSLETRKVKLSV